MIDIKLKEKTFEFPEKWNELPLFKYQDAMSLINETNEIDKNVKLLSLISDINEEDLLDLPVSEFLKINTIVNSLLLLKQDEVKFDITIEGIKYKMLTEISKMTTAEFIDLDSIVKDTDNTIQNLHIVMAILYRPINKKGDIEKYDSSTVLERAELFRNKMMCDVVLSAVLFSSALVQSFKESIKDYSDLDHQQNELSEGKKNRLMKKKNHLKKGGPTN